MQLSTQFEINMKQNKSKQTDTIHKILLDSNVLHFVRRSRENKMSIDSRNNRLCFVCVFFFLK